MGQAWVLGCAAVCVGLALSSPGQAFADEAPPAAGSAEAKPAVKYHPIHGPSHDAQE